MRDRLAPIMRRGSAGSLVGSLGLLLAAPPLDSVLDALRIWIQGIGVWAPLAVALVYALAATLFVPASALSLAAVLLFGVWLGTVGLGLRWIASTIQQYPTLAEAVRKTADGYQRTRLTPTVQRLSRTILRWRA